jgi:hypothetical protein
VLIIFGRRRRGYRMAHVLAMCGRCHSPATQAVVRIKTFFTLFFVPLIPLGTKYRSTCTNCSATIELSRDQADQALVTMAQQQQPDHAPAESQRPTASFRAASAIPAGDAATMPQAPVRNPDGGGPPPANWGS